MRLLRLCLVPSLLIFLTVHSLTGQEGRPNILWLSAEDISPHLGAYGDPYAITPNLDALAATGVRYTNTYATAGVCAPCRSGIITGMYQNSIGTHHMRGNATLPEWLKPFPLYLREAGYFCTNRTKTDYQFSDPKPKEIWDEVSNTAHWKNRKPGQPFFSVYNFVGCHESGITDTEKYHEVTKDLRPEERQDPKAFTNLPPYYPDTPVVREDWKRNYELITAMDHWAGELIDELKEAGEWENTIVMFWSDHGVGLPRAKRWLYDSGTHIPLIVNYPKAFASFATKGPGETDDRLINTIDFAPTVLALAGVSIPDYLQGQPFVGNAQRQYVYGARDRMDERYDIIRAVRDKRYRYIKNFEPLKPYDQYINTAEKGATMREIRKAQAAGTLSEAAAIFVSPQKPDEELYDLENDPYEIHNLANEPEQADKLKEMRKALEAWQFKIGDLGLIPESEILHREATAGSAYAILHETEDSSALLKDLGAAAAAASSSPGDLPKLVAFLDHQEAAIRYWGATGLGNFSAEAKKDPEIAARLEKGLGDESIAVAIASARALCRMDLPTKGLALLEQVLTGDDDTARLEAAIVLDELDDTARPLLPTMKERLELESTIVLEAVGEIPPPNPPIAGRPKPSKDVRVNRYLSRVLNKAVNDLEGTHHPVAW